MRLQSMEKSEVNVSSVKEERTPLQKQTGDLVKLCAGIATVLFILVGIVTYFNIPDHAFRDRIIESILSGITLAMAMIPEEFPVILTVFLSMGAWRPCEKTFSGQKTAFGGNAGRSICPLR